MATKRCKLPSVRVRQRSTRSQNSKFALLTRGTLKRGYPVSADCSTPGSAAKERRMDGYSHDLPDLSLLEDANEVTGINTELPTCSLYAVKQKVTADAWAAVRNKLRDGCIESSALHDTQMCAHCSVISAKMWCKRCGPYGYFCEECWFSSHSKFNMFHTPEIWEVSLYIYMWVV